MRPRRIRQHPPRRVLSAAAVATAGTATIASLGWYAGLGRPWAGLEGRLTVAILLAVAFNLFFWAALGWLELHEQRGRNDPPARDD